MKVLLIYVAPPGLIEFVGLRTPQLALWANDIDARYAGFLSRDSKCCFANFKR